MISSSGAVNSPQKVPVTLVLQTNVQVRAFPNPFSDSLTVVIEKPDAVSKVKINVFTTAGELVYKFPEKSDFESGGNGNETYEKTWDGINESGEEVGSGIYLLKIDIGDHSQIVKVAKVK